MECTVNRVRDAYFSQLERSGHARRLEDLEAIAALGVRALRYPVIWERTAPDGLDKADWTWADERLQKLRSLGIAPIAGLVHHGSGPAHTSLVSACFPGKLAEYARAVAERYPWLELYTPVNEPLTTARFSALYGAWYPHGRDPVLFKEALFNECKGVVLAMREIRKVNPGAKLVQTDDLGKYYGTPLLAYQVDMNNAMRWLGWDLLFGRVTREHPLWDWLTGACGANERDLAWFEENACPPDIVGVNYYVTSERYIDERLALFPERYAGGNGRHRYADIETARALAEPTAGIGALLAEAWERYRTPLAITEVHLDSTRDDQLRWLLEVWNAADDARAAGADVRAVTVWALFGSFDWNCLVTECRGYYEPGAFDVRGGRPRPTAIAQLMRRLAQGSKPSHPVLAGPGWWRRPGRQFCDPIEIKGSGPLLQPRSMNEKSMPPLLITGATGTLGRAFARICEVRGLAYRLVARGELDIASQDSIERALERHAPWAVINAAGYVRVDEAERDVERCFRENTHGPATLAAVCARHALPLLNFSSDLVFDGRQRAPYREADPTAPLNVYGRSKAEGEKRVLDRHPRSLVVRTSAFFGPWDVYNFVCLVLQALREGRSFPAAHDLTVSPTYVPDLVHACLDLLIDEECGLWHLTNNDPLTWADLARRAAENARIDPSGIISCNAADLGLTAPRPPYSALGSERGIITPSLDDALARYCAAAAVVPMSGK